MQVCIGRLILFNDNQQLAIYDLHNICFIPCMANWCCLTVFNWHCSTSSDWHCSTASDWCCLMTNWHCLTIFNWHCLTTSDWHCSTISPLVYIQILTHSVLIYTTHKAAPVNYVHSAHCPTLFCLSFTVILWLYSPNSFTYTSCTQHNIILVARMPFSDGALSHWFFLPIPCPYPYPCIIDGIELDFHQNANNLPAFLYLEIRTLRWEGGCNFLKVEAKSFLIPPSDFCDCSDRFPPPSSAHNTQDFCRQMGVLIGCNLLWVTVY